MATAKELSSAVQGFLAESPLKSLIGGQWVESAHGELIDCIDPGSGAKIGEVFAMQAADVDAAVAAGAEAFTSSGWAEMSPPERNGYLRRLADLIDRDFEFLVELEALDCGKLLAESPLDIACFSATLRYYAEVAERAEYRRPLAVEGHETRLSRHPYGVCGFIFPWNFPFWLTGWGISPALAAGNTVVIKPAEDTPLSTLYVGRLALEAGIPAGVVNVVAGYGESAGAALAANPGLKRMSFTGSPEVGKLIGATCGGNLVPVKLELGGKGAAVLFEDIDLEDTAAKLAGAITFHTGQMCCDCTRWLIQDTIYDQFVASVTAKMAAVKVGHGLDETSQMGPVISEKQRQRILSYLERGAAEGAETLLAGGVADVPEYPNGFYVKAGLLGGSLDNVAAREEIFGPVAYVAKFRDEAEAIAMVNSVSYGLANSVWSADLDRCNRVAEAMVAGSSWINAHNVFCAGVPFCGINRSGLGGGVNSEQTFYDYLRDLAVTRPLG